MKAAQDHLASKLKIDTWKPQKGTTRTRRYSFEITDELAEMLEDRVLAEQSLHKRRVSTSSVIRQALKEYLR